MSTPRWIPLPKAARRLGCSFETVVSLLHCGYLVGYLARPRWFVRSDSLERYIRWRDRLAA